MSKRNLGRMGESKAEHWANEQGITCNRVSDDSGGWDLFLQIPNRGCFTKPGEPLLDVTPPDISCLVQVKSTDSSSGRIGDIKLSNWEHLIKSPLPCFFLVLEYDGKNEPQRSYLVHIDQDWISMVLKRLRKIKEGEDAKLNKKTMILRFSDSDLLENPNGEALETTIRRFVGNDPHVYLRQKMEWLDNLGFEDFRIKGRFSLPSMPYERMMNLLVDFSIGNIDELRLASLHVEEVRFGIPRSLDPKATPENIRLKIPNIPKTGTAEIAIFSEDDNLVLSDSFDFYSPSTVFPFIPFDYWKSKFTSEMLSFVLLHKDKKLQMNITPLNPENKTPLAKMAKTANLINQFSITGSSRYKMVFTRGEIQFDISFHTPDFPPLNPSFLSAMKTVEDAWYIARQYDQYGQIETTINELLDQQNRVIIMKGLLKSEDIFGVSAYVADKEGIDLSSVAFIFCTGLILGETAMILTGSIQGEGEIIEEKDGYKVSVNRGRGSCVKKWTVPRANLKKFSMEKALEESDKMVSAKGIRSVVRIDGVMN